VNETCAQCQICPCTCDSPCDHNCECFTSENQHLEMVPMTTTPSVQW
jgi:hypothetical protein